MFQIRIAGLLGATGVVAGAYGAHLLEAHYQIDEKLRHLDESDIRRWKGVWETGQKIHLFGTTSTLALAPAIKTNFIKRPTLVTTCIGGGTILFSGSCYVAAYFCDRKYSSLAPLGGSMNILGWLILLFG